MQTFSVHLSRAMQQDGMIQVEATSPEEALSKVTAMLQKPGPLVLTHAWENTESFGDEHVWKIDDEDGETVLDIFNEESPA